jgi:hypothetical protein
MGGRRRTRTRCQLRRRHCQVGAVVVTRSVPARASKHRAATPALAIEASEQSGTSARRSVVRAYRPGLEAQGRPRLGCNHFGPSPHLPYSPGVSNWRIRRSSPCRSSDRKRVRRHGPVGPGVIARDRLRVAPATPAVTYGASARSELDDRRGHIRLLRTGLRIAGPGWSENRYHLGSTRPSCRIEQSSVQRSVPLGFQVPHDAVARFV